ncbi:MAG: hypothetical protein EOP41_06545 [Sphingobacteriaceae bacterium]|nr:MAG: hypothetical protein EOP41_06545 [Sphingobacteriaceae bacterium]
MNQEFDIGILGGGCAGLQLLYHLTQQKQWPGLKVLLIDDPAEKSNASWCFWSKPDHPLQHLVSKSWENLCFKSTDGMIKQESIAPYRYHYIQGENFFNYFWQELIPANTNITVARDQVTHICKQASGFYIETNHQNFTVKKCFSSIITQEFKPAAALWQHFKGWHIEVDTGVFDDKTATLMDFSVPAAPANCFIYILPFSRHKALIEATFFSMTIASDHVYEQLIRQYISSNYPGLNYRVISAEKGRIPLSQQLGSHYGRAGEVLIGTAGGMVKATSGYAFSRIDRDSKLLAQHLMSGDEQKRSGTKGRFRFYDTLFLRILKEHPDCMASIFKSLFLKNRIKNVLQFLDEDTSIAQESTIFATLPLMPFIKQALKYCIRSNIGI